jgi:hypothetical protein
MSPLSHGYQEFPVLFQMEFPGETPPPLAVINKMDTALQRCSCRIWGSHGGEYEDDCLLVYSTV